MRRRLPILLLLATGCIYGPSSRIEREKGANLTISGFVHGPNMLVKVRAHNYSTGAQTLLTNVVSDATEAFPDSNLYFWSATLTGLTSSSNYWVPPSIGAISGGTSSNGRIEISAHLADDTRLVTFTDAAKECLNEHIGDGYDPYTAGDICHDGDELVLFDNTGITQGAEPLEWVVDFSGSNEIADWDFVHYESQGLTIYAYVCYPQTPPPPGGYPVHILNHGGTRGLANDWDLDQCRWFAAAGWLTAMSAYRGEGIHAELSPADPMTPPVFASDGLVELCLGEVTDVMRLLAILPHEVPDADMDHVLMSGISHGGCITMRAIERGARVHAAVDVYGPTDWALFHDECQDCTPLTDYLETLAGGDPLAAPNAYAWRSPAQSDSPSNLFAGDLAARTDVQVMILHGAEDTLVPPNQSCRLAQTAWGSTSQRYFVDADGDSDHTGLVDDCNQPWLNQERPLGSWPGNRYLLVYEGANHAGGPHLLGDMFDFIATRYQEWTP